MDTLIKVSRPVCWHSPKIEIANLGRRYSKSWTQCQKMDVDRMARRRSKESVPKNISTHLPALDRTVRPSPLACERDFLVVYTSTHRHTLWPRRPDARAPPDASGRSISSDEEELPGPRWSFRWESHPAAGGRFRERYSTDCKEFGAGAAAWPGHRRSGASRQRGRVGSGDRRMTTTGVRQESLASGPRLTLTSF